MAARQRASALESYYKDPKRCRYCNTVITVQEGQKIPVVRKKKFCNHTCAANAHNKRSIRVCKNCNSDFMPLSRGQRWCEDCKDGAKVATRSKGQLFSQSPNWQSARSTLQKHARKAFNKEASCVVCQYSKHIEVAHVRAVSDFPDDTLVSEINHPDNLIGLCPNHHWEFDNGQLQLSAEIGSRGCVAPT